MTWLLLLVGLVAAPLFSMQFIRAVRTGVTRGTAAGQVKRGDNPIVFKMALALNGMFVVMALWFIFEGLKRLSS